jgi:hypothetical protein
MAVKRETETKGWNARNNVTDALIAHLDRQIEEVVSSIEKEVKEWDLFNPSRNKRSENQAANRAGAKSKVSQCWFSRHSIISRVIFPLSFQPPTPAAFPWTVNPSTTSRTRLFPTSPNCYTPSTAI